ncbi:MAG: hypothetical protein ACI87A_000095 [Planctomycetota bacterium]|jgi:hypothetical protein
MNPQLTNESSLPQVVLNSAAKLALQAGDSASLHSIVCEVHPGIFVADLVQHSWCEALLNALDEFDTRCRAEGAPPEPPNSMHDYGVVLESAGLDAPMESSRNTHSLQTTVRDAIRTLRCTLTKAKSHSTFA